MTLELCDLFPQLPPESLLADPAAIDALYRRNVTGLDRHIPLVVRPSGEAEVRYVVGRANVRGVPLYPLSVGKNWGLGSKLPVRDGCVVLDLSRMDRVIEVHEAGRYTVIEPGVTQGRLATHLSESHPALTFNLTGAPAGTSVVGNLLDRGDGAGPRIDDLLGVAGVLGDGTPFEVGGHCGATPSVAAHLSRYAAGPDLVGVFSQSNYAIVTRAAFRLRPRPARRYVVWGSVAANRLGDTVARLRELGDQRAFAPGTLNLGYANRFVQAGPTMTGEAIPADTAWQFYLLIDGAHRIADAARDVAMAELADTCHQMGVFQVGSPHPRNALPTFLHPLARPLLGEPDTESIKLIYHLTGTPLPADGCLDVDQTPFGMRCLTPLVPFVPVCVLDVARITDEVRRDAKLNVKTSFYGDGRSLVTVHFRTDIPEQLAVADRAEATLWDRLSAAGYLPYRSAVHQMARTVAQRPDFFRLVARLKRAFDPAGVVAPGRYAEVDA